MFTGIVQFMGVVRAIRRGSAAARLVLDAPGLPRPLVIGSSIAVNGVCLTVTAFDDSRIEFDVIPETLSRSTLGALAAGAAVNLEPSLRAGDPLDGHMVQGHVDGVGVVRSIESGTGGHVVTFEAGEELMPFVIPKGSIALDGVSLTVASVAGNRFSVALIPTTLGATTLSQWRVGQRVNVETDILARTVVSTLKRWHASETAPALTLERLRENGW
jgi:riboflavin synthase alpha subunit